MSSRDMSQNAKLRSDDMEHNPKLDSARDVDQNPKLDSSDMATDPKLDSLDFFIKSNYKQSRPL